MVSLIWFSPERKIRISPLSLFFDLPDDVDDLGKLGRGIVGDFGRS